ncbi:hypothetical protein ABZ387_33975 [Streptomyces flaveolus]|uniref:hypothetical protein n=1 Tax=Streptomyces flaveolus TaxID=67297 RepID=UPI0033C0759B
MRKGSEILVSLIDELLAVWEGKPARGYCGTADVVAYPTRQGIPVRIVGPKEPAVALFVSAGCARTGTGRPSQSETSGNRPLDGGGFAAFSARCKRGQSLLPGPRPPKDSPPRRWCSSATATPARESWIRGRLSIRLSIAAEAESR